jgi:predicted CxxxxCH...CXXCH cytochrome family protein
VGAHLAHVNQGATAPPLSNAFRCDNCHVEPASAGPHGLGLVVWGSIATAGGASPSYDLVNHTCSSTWCHGNFPGGNGVNTVAWGTGTPSKQGCTACHGGPPAHPHLQNLGCAACHAGYTATTVAAATHVDGVVSKTTSGCTSCHGALSVAGVTLTSNLVAAAPGVTGTNTVDTTGQAAATSAGVGVHRAHLGAGTFGRVAIACTECHALPPTNADTGHATGGAGTGGARATLTWGPTATSAESFRLRIACSYFRPVPSCT